MGYLRRGKWIRDEKFVCMCLWSCMNTVDVYWIVRLLKGVMLYLLSKLI
jgi:hypothetical protein